MIVVLDTGPLGMVTHPRASGENRECSTWLRGMLEDGQPHRHPGNLRLRAETGARPRGQAGGIETTRCSGERSRYLPLDTVVMRHAAHLWALARNEGRPTASMDALDADVILAAQTLSLRSDDEAPLLATTNVGHLARFIDARAWREIS